MRIASLCLAALFVSICAHAANLPKYGPNAIPLSADHNAEYFKTHTAPDFWALVSYYLPQISDSGCSAANIAMVLNAGHDVRLMNSAEKLVTIQSLTEKYTDERYAKAVSPNLDYTKFDHSVVSNANLAKVILEAIHKLHLETSTTSVTAVAIDKNHLDQSRQAFHKALVENEKSSDDFIIISFVQGILTGDPEGGAHVATIGAYDAKKKLVLIFDPDREWYGPYWSPESKVFDSIQDPRSDYAAPGWIHVKFR